MRPAATFKPEVASLNMGSMNFGLYPMLNRFKEFKHDWERPYLEGTRDRHLPQHLHGHRVHPDDLRENGTRFEFECYDIGHLYTLAHFVDAAWSSRRSSSSRCSASSAASARIPRTSCT